MPRKTLAIDTMAALACLCFLAAAPALAAMDENRDIDRVLQPDLASGMLEKEADLLGETVVSAGGTNVGTVDAVVASASGQGRFLVIGTDLGAERYLPVPEYRLARLDNDRLRILAPDPILAEAPRFATADIAGGPGGWPEGLEVWWLERLDGPGFKPRPRPAGSLTATGEEGAMAGAAGRPEAPRKY